MTCEPWHLGKHAVTPRLDAFAKNALVFMQNHVQQAVCGPVFPLARASAVYLGSTAEYSIRVYIQYLGAQTLSCFVTRVIILSGTQ